jgi:cytoplasmic iron level regulating protein YaaA (DUF328/UPF0246 family)
MLTLLSPAKKLLTIEKPYQDYFSLPIFHEKTAELVAIMQSKSAQDIANLMHLSPALAELNFHRYQNFLHEQSSKYPAIFLFQGDVYQGLQAAKWDSNTVDFAQSHLLTLSGLYGLLKPLDLMQPYRLEMGTKLLNPLGKNLYAYWTTAITQILGERLTVMNNPMLINLASMEYFKVVDENALPFPILHIHFREQINNTLKTIGIYAKKARGLMANYLMQNQIDDLESIKGFDVLNYQFCKKQSDKQHLVFIRKH